RTYPASRPSRRARIGASTASPAMPARATASTMARLYRVAGGRPRPAPPWGRGRPGPSLAHTGEKTHQPDTPDICVRLVSKAQARFEKTRPPTERATGADGQRPGRLRAAATVAPAFDTAGAGVDRCRRRT